MSAMAAVPAARNVNLRRLLQLRTATILTEVLAILIAGWGFGIELPFFWLGIILVVMGVLNLYAWRRLRRLSDVSDHEFLVQILFDATALFAVLMLTGGATNPFAWFFMLPLVISATLLPRRYTLGIALATVLGYTILLFYYVPLPGMMVHAHGGFELHVFGMWFGFVLIAGLIAYVVVGMAQSLRAQERNLAEVREQALRDERIVALGTLAAGAAHELGTPLGTMAIVVGELKDNPGCTDPALKGQLELLDSQIIRCKEALSVISASAGELRAEEGEALGVERFLDDVVGQWQAQRPGIELAFRPSGDFSDQKILADRTLIQALINILNNAADASPQDVSLHATCSQDGYLCIEVLDRGSGMPGERMGVLGKEPVSSKDHGMGIGVYLAHAAIERNGGTIHLHNREGGGVSTQVNLPLLKS